MDEIEQVKQRVDIVELISSYLTVKKAGASYRALCPFHNEKTPSMMISPEKQIFKCFGCFLGQTEIITSQGIVPIKKITKDSLVLSHKGQWQQVLVKFKRHYHGEIIKLMVRQTNEPIYLTPNHQVFIIQTKNCKQNGRLTRLCQAGCQQNCSTRFFRDYKLQKKEISEAKKGDYLLYPLNKTVKDINQIKLYDRKKYLESRKAKSGFPAYDFPEKVKVDANLLRFLGYWIAEGSVYARGVRFSLGSHEKDFASEIMSLSKNIFGLKASIYESKKDKSGIEISISNINLNKIMTSFCGKGAANKKIPEFCLNLPVEKQKILLEAIFKGDGTTAKGYSKTLPGRKSITTISNLLALQLKDLLLRMSIKPVTTFNLAHKDKNGVNHRACWIVSWMPNQTGQFSAIQKIGGVYYWLLPIKSMEKEEFNGEVYNLMVKNDSSYVVKNFSVSNCGEGGDVLAFVMKMENLNFREALEMLAQRAGVKLVQRTPQKAEQEAKEKDTKTRLFQINMLSAQVFHKILLTHPSAKEALAYLKKRKITEQTMKDFMIGYAPSSSFMHEYLNKKGFTNQEIAAAGSPDRFYKRIIFPIVDVMGNVLGFTGRVLDPNIQPKYLNTSETVIFHKGRILYNLVHARGEIKLAKTTVVVEGQMDVISSFQAGVKNVVATSGTALTPEHLQILFRYTPNITFAFDSDTAGQNTSKKAYEMALAQGFNVKMTDLGSYKDPGEMIENNPPAGGPALWQKTVVRAQPVIDWYFDLAFRSYQDQKGESSDLSSQQKKEIAKEILPVIRKIPDTIERAHYVELLSKKLALPDRIIFDALDRVVSAQNKNPTPQLAQKIKISTEEILVGIFARHPEVLAESIKNIEPKDFADSWSEQVYSSIINWYNKDSQKGELLPSLKKKLKTPDWNKLEVVLMEVESKYSIEAPTVAKDIIARIKEQKREKLKEHFAKEISLAEARGDK